MHRFEGRLGVAWIRIAEPEDVRRCSRRSVVDDGNIAAGEAGVAAVSGEVVFVGVVLMVIGVDAEEKERQMLLEIGTFI
ncbi:hypothetical protein Ahy_B03g063240 isoform F [Arachis hypogaea]|uniref:Uncharacterized protein n=1 Tax=Arachis hypogaea TaxID=3818 RepID=A0A444ZX39_ARAHY|nr:hypothetical protein Ahy_B03g063240 isoform F [Arachis hypogaea]